MVDALPRAEIIHAMPGRVRLRIAARRGDTVFFASVATGLAAIAGVQKVEVRPLTGSILIHHGAPLAQVGAAARKARLFVISEAAPAPLWPPPKWPVLPPLPIDPRMAAAFGLGLAAIWQAIQGRVLPPALTAAWYAAHLSGLLASDGAPHDGE
jgi:hypothetical protein